MNVFSEQTGDGSVVSIPNNLDNLTISTNKPYKHVLVYVLGTYQTDKRVGTTDYEVSVTRVSHRHDGMDVLDGDYDYIHLLPVGSKGSCDVVTLTEVSA
ncbi:hypothetical protein HISP_08670 [Haloarcula hispanica N601]|uniref:Uncharacterized protein n=2 Tax=Haloarcula hispanica TaxID=51589 RepID=V5TS62_HALHI|nr:hypothetical protein [Haloarcula hispanica]AEM57302.1 hypothetical protein HAH_1699 [Haloarcula hispanica ATCC 33960]AHB67490.1 hypothetical protein HISP_08670 [Haloarcula hispanica N601]